MRLFFKEIAVLLLLGVVSTLGGCTAPTDDGTHTDPVTLYEKIGGGWKLTNITQVDETARAASMQPQEMSLFSQFEFATFAISFDLDAALEPTTYKVTGSAPDMFPASGYWDLDTPFAWTNSAAPVVRLYSDAGRSTRTGELAVVSTPGAVPEMSLRLVRSERGVPFVSYVYKLSSTKSNAK